MIGWGILFVVLGVCAFYWDRDLSVFALRRKKSAPPKRELRWPAIVIRVVNLLAILSAVVWLWGLYLQDRITLIEMLALAIFLAFAVVLVHCFIWYVTSWLRYDRVVQQLRAFRFKLVHLLVATALVALLLGIVRMLVERDEVAFRWWVIAGSLFFSALIGTVFYIGAESLFFGYGSGKRMNRLRELEKDHEIRLPTRCKDVSRRRQRKRPPSGPVS
ncbi:hypothetical protein AB1K70_07200 [Bremerella sp. JC770]|uniref:hypothetical protein n=1 Tax=Bremerella sp. JC770 TaxID=3232137 RepID=UPI00345A7B1E